MIKPIQFLRKVLRRHLTIILIPHSSAKTRKTTFTFSFLLFIVFFWTGLTIWATYLASRHIDYLRVKLDREIMKFKLMFFANELQKSQELLAQVKERDEQLRKLLEMKSKKAIITSDSIGKGGPSTSSQRYLEKFLEKRIHELDVKDLQHQTKQLREESKEQLVSIEEINSFITYQQALYRSMPNMWPCAGRYISPFGFRIHPVTGSYEFHTGIDICNVRGTKIYATADGVVKFTGWTEGYGKLIIIEHKFGFKTYYAHLWKSLVKNGQKVTRGEVIGLMGDSGTTTGTHLHYEVWHNNKVVNPKRFLDKDVLFKGAKGYFK
ncbi:MAG: M23 family metallopeptidase [Elusimicrobiota bacterium]|nr:M23 family metallopeptidase [Elusimicrobiota bacterium]